MPNFAHRIASTLAATVFLVCVATGADAASIMYNVADLGNGFSFTKDSTGYTTAVTSGDGSKTYSFDKYPVTYQQTALPLQPRTSPDFAQQNIVAFNKYMTLEYTYHYDFYNRFSETSSGAFENEGNSSPVHRFQHQGTDRRSRNQCGPHQ